MSSWSKLNCQPFKIILGLTFICHLRLKQTTQMGKISPQPTQRLLIWAVKTKQGSQSPGCKTDLAAGLVMLLWGKIDLKSRPHPLDFLFPLFGARGLREGAGEVWERGRQLWLKIQLLHRGDSEGKREDAGGGAGGGEPAAA